MAAKRFLLHMIEMARRLRKALRSPRGERIAWGAAVAIFFGGLAFSLASRPSLASAIRFDSMAILVFALCPLMTGVNMLITRELSRAAGVRLSYVASLKLAVMSTAANHLPAPGGPLLRIAAFREAGATLKEAGMANVAQGLIWMSAAFLFAGPWALALDFLLGFCLIGLGLALLAVAIAIAGRLPGSYASGVRLFAVSFLSAALYALSIHVALQALGAVWSFPQAAVIAAAGVIGAASSIAPAGLGVREAASAGLATLIGADPAAAFAATATVHVAMVAVMAACAAVFAAGRRKPATLL